MAAGGDPGAMRNYARNKRQERRQQKGKHYEAAPKQGSRGRQHGPPAHEREETRWRRQAAAKVVNELPTAKRRNIGSAEAASRLAKNPRKQLPVAARPTVLARCGNIVTRRKVLKDLDIGDQSRAGKYALQQVVAENAAFRDTAGESGLEGIHIVNTLATVGALLEQVLINVGHGGGIWVDAGWAREHALIDRAIPLGRKRRRHSWLQHAITLDHTVRYGIEPRPVERVRHFPNQALCGANREPRVGVQGDDVTHARRHQRQLATHGQEQ